MFQLSTTLQHWPGYKTRNRVQKNSYFSDVEDSVKDTDDFIQYKRSKQQNFAESVIAKQRCLWSIERALGHWKN